MSPVTTSLVVLLALLLATATRVRIKQYELVVLFRLGKVSGTRSPGLRLIIPVVDVSAVTYFRVVDERLSETDRINTRGTTMTVLSSTA